MIRISYRAPQERAADNGPLATPIGVTVQQHRRFPSSAITREEALRAAADLYEAVRQYDAELSALPGATPKPPLLDVPRPDAEAAALLGNGAIAEELERIGAWYVPDAAHGSLSTVEQAVLAEAARRLCAGSRRTDGVAAT